MNTQKTLKDFGDPKQYQDYLEELLQEAVTKEDGEIDFSVLVSAIEILQKLPEIHKPDTELYYALNAAVNLVADQY